MKKWEYYEIDVDKIREFREEFKISELLARVLVNRNVQVEEVEVFLNPTRKDFYDPFLMPDMEKAVGRIIEAINNKEKVIVYGDYDVDGITSTVVLKSFLEERGLEVGVYIPNRLKEGYGLNKEAIEKIAEEYYDLIITVDSGISAIEEIDLCNELGIDVIVTDHHEQMEELPNAYAVVNHKRKDNKYPFRGLAGVGVVFKVIQALSLRLELPEKEYLKYLDLVAIGTIADIVPLVDENRVITKLGLKLVEVTRNVGLKELMKVAGFKEITAMSMAFGIAPRINACGRMGKQHEAVELLEAKDTKQANEIALRLNEFNLERQSIEKKILRRSDRADRRSGNRESKLYSTRK